MRHAGTLLWHTNSTVHTNAFCVLCAGICHPPFTSPTVIHSNSTWLTWCSKHRGPSRATRPRPLTQSTIREPAPPILSGAPLDRSEHQPPGRLTCGLLFELRLKPPSNRHFEKPAYRPSRKFCFEYCGPHTPRGTKSRFEQVGRGDSIPAGDVFALQDQAVGSAF